MKLLHIILFISFLCQSTLVSGQSIAFAENPDYMHVNDSSYTIHHRRHCTTTRIGEGILIGGGAFVVTGLGIILFSKNDGLGGGLLVAGGEFFGVVGGIFFCRW